MTKDIKDTIWARILELSLNTPNHTAMSEDFMKFDEDDAVKFIRGTLPNSVNERYSDDEILYVIDTIWDWYEKNGYLSLDAEVTDDELLDEDKLVAYVKKEIKNDNEIMMDPEDVGLIVKGELQYEESIDNSF